MNITILNKATDLPLLTSRTSPIEGDWVEIREGKSVIKCEWHESETQAELDETKTKEERSWRDSELLRTDALILLPDHPKQEELIAYRVLLREYPLTVDFPYGTRPVE